MKRATRKPLHRMAVAATVMSFVGLGLATPFIISGSDRELSLQTATVIAATRDTFTLTAPVALGPLSNFRLDRGTVSLVPPGGPAEPMTGAAALALLTSGRAKLEVDNATLSMDLGRFSPHAGEIDETSFAPVLAALVNMSFSELVFRDSEVRITRADGSLATLTNVEFNLTRQRGGRVKAVGRFSFRDRPLAVNLTLATTPSVAGAAPLSFPLDLSIESDLINLRATGGMTIADTPQFAAEKAEIDIRSIREFAAWLGADWGSGGGLGKFKVTGPLDWTPRGIDFPAAKIEIDGNVAVGALALKMMQQRASIDGTLDFETLDLSVWRDEVTKSSLPTTFDLSSILPRHLTGRPVFPILQDVDADLRISAGKVIAAGVKFEKGAASLSLKNGVMLADIAELEFGKLGRCAGQLSVAATGDKPRYQLKSKIEGIDVRLIGGALWSHAPLSGAGELTVDIETAGIDRAELLRTAAGKVGVKMPAAGQLGIDVKTLAATARTAELHGWGGAARGQTPIEAFTAQLVLDDGRLWVDRAVAKSGDAGLRALGSVHLESGLSDIQLWITHAPAKSEPSSPGAMDAGRADRAAPGTAEAINTAATSAPGGGLLIRGPLSYPTIRFMTRLEQIQGAPRPVAPVTSEPPDTAKPGRAQVETATPVPVPSAEMKPATTEPSPPIETAPLPPTAATASTAATPLAPDAPSAASAPAAPAPPALEPAPVAPTAAVHPALPPSVAPARDAEQVPAPVAVPAPSVLPEAEAPVSSTGRPAPSGAERERGNETPPTSPTPPPSAAPGPT